MIGPDIFLPVAFVLLIGLLAAMVLISLPRGKRMQQTNEKIEQNQRRIIENGEAQMALALRSAEALERIAAALERRG